jgi:hypothetical protein
MEIKATTSHRSDYFFVVIRKKNRHVTHAGLYANLLNWLCRKTSPAKGNYNRATGGCQN